ncbi:glycoside hydrolase family 15 protein [Arthrobacter sp. zg-Y20]|uniref:glycoside hydrolase family 15 protein n=1 Tax=unclassified Arthrobacter TaxID=235627 RepID=UPI001D15A0F3|nr:MULTISPECIES: glycoside hydrolase family 15 protein [unclassified Arthrobacter]MCC3276601.1 glycoside hydrolase family 15 protein [Arthrobacter sp. zg-Y20]MDK1316761.1 glycoside hydrolase family 15 protein [Arthrobacter sp. zg.Y20]WIB06821.1 glycoside hydrolase family 15 protein [Arthrobacter sp. zg-Y20]
MSMSHPDRTDGYVDLRSYGAIGDGRTVALVALDGSIDWYPTPDLDSTPAFARLLDAENGGQIELRPVADFTVERAYVAGTNVLATTFTTGTGSVRVTDSLNTGVAGRLPWGELARRIEGLDGEVQMRWAVTPGSSFNTASPWVQQTVHGPVLQVQGTTIAVRGRDIGTEETSERDISGTFTARAGSRHLLAVISTHDEPLPLPDPDTIDDGVDRTIANWQDWSREFQYEGRWSDAVERSALALKLLLHSPTGAIAAAATTSLPENVHGGKNWDYRYAWVRDTAYTLHAMIRFGLREEVHAAVSGMLKSVREQGSDLKVFTRLNGSRAEDAEVLDMPGWRGIGPVVNGNDAAAQLQMGVFGDLFNIVQMYVDAGHVLDTGTGRYLADLADMACDVWQRRDSGMWELDEERHYTTSKLGCWHALSCASHLADLGQIPGNPERWRAEMERIRNWVDANCWSEERGSYVWYPGTDQLDASILLHAISGFDRGERMSSTLDALRGELGRGPLLYRFSGAEKEEGTFVACAFWMAAALDCVGRREEAATLMDELVPLANDVGLYTEMIAEEDSAFLGNFPQGLSHLALITAALTLGEERD